MQKEQFAPEMPIATSSNITRSFEKPKFPFSGQSTPKKYKFKIFPSNGRTEDQVKDELQRRKSIERKNLNESLELSKRLLSLSK